MGSEQEIPTSELGSEIAKMVLTTGASDLKTLRPLDQHGFDHIAHVLSQKGHMDESHIPRTYAILSAIDAIEQVDLFLDNGIKDLALPHTQDSLPPLPPAIKRRFLDAQHVALTRTHSIEDVARGCHLHLRAYTDLCFRDRGFLGAGGQRSEVRKASGLRNNRDYALKLIRRIGTYREEKVVLEQFAAEVQSAQAVKHHHIVQVICSFTDTHHVGIVMGTVGEYNLETFLAMPVDMYKRALLRDFFGCLASALSAVHQANVRHKDIKPTNLVIRHAKIYLIDFGIAVAFESPEVTTGPGAPGLVSAKYCAPEVADHDKRNMSSDIWSLGTVFLEMATRLLGSDLSELTVFLEANGTLSSRRYYENIEGCFEWLEYLQSLDSKEHDRLPLKWIRDMIRGTPTDRLTAGMLLEQMKADANAMDCNFFCYACHSADEQHASVRQDKESRAHRNGVAQPASIDSSIKKCGDQLSQRANDNPVERSLLHRKPSLEVGCKEKRSASVGSIVSEQVQTTAPMRDDDSLGGLRPYSPATSAATFTTSARAQNISTSSSTPAQNITRSYHSVQFKDTSIGDPADMMLWSPWQWSAPHRQYYCRLKHQDGSIRYAWRDGRQRVWRPSSHEASQPQVKEVREQAGSDKEDESDEEDESDSEDDSDGEDDHDGDGVDDDDAKRAKGDKRKVEDAAASSRERSTQLADESRSGTWALAGATFGAAIFGTGVYVGSTIKATAAALWTVSSTTGTALSVFATNSSTSGTASSPSSNIKDAPQSTPVDSRYTMGLEESQFFQHGHASVTSYSEQPGNTDLWEGLRDRGAMWRRRTDVDDPRTAFLRRTASVQAIRVRRCNTRRVQMLLFVSANPFLFPKHELMHSARQVVDVLHYSPTSTERLRNMAIIYTGNVVPPLTPAESKNLSVAPETQICVPIRVDTRDPSDQFSATSRLDYNTVIPIRMGTDMRRVGVVGPDFFGHMVTKCKQLTPTYKLVPLDWLDKLTPAGESDTNILTTNGSSEAGEHRRTLCKEDSTEVMEDEEGRRMAEAESIGRKAALIAQKAEAVRDYGRRSQR